MVLNVLLNKCNDLQEGVFISGCECGTDCRSADQLLHDTDCDLRAFFADLPL